MASNAPDNLEQEIKQVISDVTGRTIEELTPEANFWQDLGVDFDYFVDQQSRSRSWHSQNAPWKILTFGCQSDHA